MKLRRVNLAQERGDIVVDGVGGQNAVGEVDAELFEADPGPGFR